MNKKLVTTFALAATLLVGSVASAANWNGLENYPEVPNSANGTETYYFDKDSGAMWTNTTLEKDGKTYIIDENGVATEKVN